MAATAILTGGNVVVTGDRYPTTAMLDVVSNTYPKPITTYTKTYPASEVTSISSNQAGVKRFELIYQDETIIELSETPGDSGFGNTIFGAVTVDAATLAAATSVGGTGSGGGGGAPVSVVSGSIDLTPATINQISPGLSTDAIGTNTVIGQLKRLVQLGQDDVDFSELIVQETTGAKRVVARQVVRNEVTGVLTTTFVNLDGSSLAPVISLPVVPIGGTDYETVNFSYNATVAGTGYSVGDTLQQVNIVDASSGVVTSTLWYNRSTQLVLSVVPPAASLRPESDLLENLVTNQTTLTGYYKIRQKYVATSAGPGFAPKDVIEAEDTYRGSAFIGTAYTNIVTGAPVLTGQTYPIWVPVEDQDTKNIANISKLATDAASATTAPYTQLSDSVTGFAGTIKTTTPLTTDTSLVVSLSPNSAQPNTTLANRALTQITDGTTVLPLITAAPATGTIALPVRQVVDSVGNTQTIGATLATSVNTKLSDGTNAAVIKTAAPATTDNAIVVSLHPNSVQPNLTQANAAFVKIADGTNSLILANAALTSTTYSLPVRLPPDAAGNTVTLGSTIGTAPFAKLTDGTNSLTNFNTLPSSTVYGLPIRQVADSVGNTQTIGSTLATSVKVQLNDGVDQLDFVNTAPLTTAYGLPVRLPPDAVGNTVTLGSTIGSSPFVKLTDGTNSLTNINSLPPSTTYGLPVRQVVDSAGNTQTIGATLATSANVKVGDGLLTAKVNAASTQPVAASQALVVVESPNNTTFASLTPAAVATQAVLTAGRYLVTAPILTDLQQTPLLTSARGNLLTATKYLTTSAGQIAPAPDTVPPVGKKIFRIIFTNNSAAVIFLQLFDQAAALATGSVPLFGFVFRIPSNSTFVVDESTFSEAGELIGTNTRIGLSSTFGTFTAATGANLSQCSLNYKVEI